MGKSSSKLSFDPSDTRFKQASLASTTSSTTNSLDEVATNKTTTNAATASNILLNEKNLRDWCRGFNKEFPNTELSQILDNDHLLAPFLTNIFYQEVEVSDSMQTLFRGNCLASKIMSHCFRTFGSKYLKQLLEPHIKPLMQHAESTNFNKDSAVSSPQLARTKSGDGGPTASTQNLDYKAQLINRQSCVTTTKRPARTTDDIKVDCDNNNTSFMGTHKRKQLSQDETIASASRTKSSISYEIDSARLGEEDNIDINQQNLLKLTREILDSILSSAADFPQQLNLMCICLKEVLCKKYPDSNTSLKAVGTVIFLRFINPAIVSPFEARIVDRPPSPKTMRGLMLVSKILQNIANNVEFSKEEHMLPFNDFVRGQFEPLRQWVAEISSERNQQ